MPYRFRVALDDGPTVEVTAGSREFLQLERDEVDLSTMKPTEGSYTLVFYALRRLVRQGKVTVDLPESVEEFMDWADLESLDGEDPEGKGSAPDLNTGGSPESS